jgi:hypothetical protein
MFGSQCNHQPFKASLQLTTPYVQVTLCKADIDLGIMEYGKPMHRMMNGSARSSLGLGTLVILLATIATLVSEVRADSIQLTWKAPSDRGGDAVSTYDIRYDTIPITEGTWGVANQITGEPAPQAPGSIEVFAIQGLTAGTRYYFALKVADAVGNWSDLSNLVSYVIGPSAAPPSIYAFPNPFRVAEISEITFTGAPSDVTILTLSGEVVRRWTNSTAQEIRWDGRNASGYFVASGIYLWYANPGEAKGKIELIR